MPHLTEYYCVTHDAGSWNENALGSNNKPIVKIHRDLGCNVVEVKDKPKLIGKVNWGRTEIEKLVPECLLSHWDEWLHEVIASYKPGKVCLIKNKWQYLYPIGNYFKSGVTL
jgi:hypothetical protein